MNVVRLGGASRPVAAPAHVLWDVVTGIESGRDVLPDVVFATVSEVPPLLGVLLAPLAALLRLRLGDRAARRASGPTMERLADAVAREATG